MRSDDNHCSDSRLLTELQTMKNEKCFSHPSRAPNGVPEIFVVLQSLITLSQPLVSQTHAYQATMFAPISKDDVDGSQLSTRRHSNPNPGVP